MTKFLGRPPDLWWARPQCVRGNDWYVWTASGVGAAGLVTLLVLFQRARAQRMAARAHADGA
ncbi:hypothetical protein E3O45_11945 [Cryobacterium sp. TMS1-20-1]|uniref:hypothetical protein n=1 Tax=Cryobacterium sp. TMS1-20-1 TaxID=1259223 RepID=UPI00106BA982|nr:hypothetical protein [Cryobacterium sp. TMS1-20-1]TFC73602.1 hypothetical protein E3O45_11945 [Cryobacterium sp. TMS1-20-1]